ncbi:nitroreductase [Thermocatellispora tengchongensis]|uniref:Nitroreductase n=1 Tax=Thermocatellispora tengchongensis TaxID=1073253 RepID=A0A840P5U2_9ACTN|nr:nitroreductase family protein [Thermocatellispora tengchongensis]MBB5131385.1 nitroreductase [Thermocatellispora tengchongensis]
MGDGTRAGVASLRATRWFTGEPVPTGEIVRVLEAARWTGSARNRQPWRFVVVRDRELQRRLSLLGGYAGHLATAPVVVLLAIDHGTGGEDAEFDGGRVAQSLMLAAHAAGLGSCPASFFPAANVARAGRLAGVEPPWRVRTAISLGYPAPAPEGRSAIPTGRLPLDRLVRWIEPSTTVDAAGSSTYVDTMHRERIIGLAGARRGDLDGRA